MVNEKMAEMLAGLADRIRDSIGGDPNGCYLYAEATGGSTEVGIFRDKGETVAYLDFEWDLFDVVADIWKAAARNEKWAVLHYEIKDGKFDARFEYPDALNPEETIHDRRQRALRERYGDNPVIYPPFDEAEYHEIDESELSKD